MHIERFGEQAADMRHAALSRNLLMPHTRQSLDQRDFLLFPDDVHDLPDDVSDEEAAMMLKMSRLGG